jgi:hypothetical protein
MYRVSSLVSTSSGEGCQRIFATSGHLLRAVVRKEQRAAVV